MLTIQSRAGWVGGDTRAQKTFGPEVIVLNREVTRK